MIDLKYIIKEFKEFVENHNQVYSFGYGPIDQIQTEDREYPLIWLSSKSSNMASSYMNLSFDVYILTNQRQDHSNLIDSMNDMLYIGRDIINNFFDSDIENGFEIDTPISFGPIIFEFDDVVGGWVYDLKLEIPLNDGCNVPD